MLGISTFAALLLLGEVYMTYALSDEAAIFMIEKLADTIEQKAKTAEILNGKKLTQPIPKDPDVGKDMIEITHTRGYTIDTHYVTTEDGYILTMFNIPHGKGGEGRGKHPVILQHGLWDSSYTWVNNFEDQSLGFLLADNGFDVWFGNNRGNRYGRNHTTLNPDSTDLDERLKFWSFTWDEMALYDLPAMIDYVSSYTAASSVGWVGHSEGTIQMFAAGTMTQKVPRVQKALEKLSVFVGLAPVAYVKNIPIEEVQALAQTKACSLLIKRGFLEIFPYGRISAVAPTLCRLTPGACEEFFNATMGPSTNLNVSRLQVYVSETPAGTSTLNMDHWAQGVAHDAFQMYDFGKRENMQRYGQTSPPLYDLAAFTPRVALFSGLNDYLADVKDVQRLISELPKEKIVYQDVQDDYAHCDFVWAPNASSRIYPQVISLLKQYA